MSIKYNSFQMLQSIGYFLKYLLSAKWLPWKFF